jgi:hypothetical protein
MVYSPIMPNMKLTAADMGVPDYANALRKGFQTAADVYKPSTAATALLDAMLKNKHSQIINDYLPRSEEARIGHMEAGTGLLGQQSKYYGRNIESEIALRDAQRGLYGAQAQKAAQEAALRKALQDKYLSNDNIGAEERNQTTNPEYQQGINLPFYAQNMQSTVFNQPEVQKPKTQQIPFYARKLLGLPEEFPQEKMNREIATSNIKAQNTQNITRVQEIREAAKDLSLAGIDINGIHDILTGPDSLSTGITKTLIGKLGFGSEKLGELNERALRLQAQMTKAISSRGGVGAANIVASGKPSGWKSTSENLGISKAYAERINNEFNLLNQEYKSITGKELPYTLPEYVNNIGKKIDKHSFKPKINFSNAKEYHDYMKALSPEQRRIEIKELRALRGASK